MDADNFEVVHERRDAGAWQPRFSVTYRRTAPAAVVDGDSPR
jgi:hypothetical protein